MRQLALSLAPSPVPTLENFVRGRNAELVALLSSLLQGEESERFIYIWGVPGSGKTHLLRAMHAAFRRRNTGSTLIDSRDRMIAVDPRHVILVDDVQALSGDAQQKMFNVYNQLRDGGGVLIAAGAMPSTRLPLREDLVTRLGWGLAYQLHTLSDDEKMTAMLEHARARGFGLSREVMDYLFNRQSRDLPGLLALLDALDRYSLESKRAITVPLVRELLSSRG